MPSDISQWLGLGGVALGGILALAAGYFQDRRRRNFERESFAEMQLREDHIRVIQWRFDIYVKFLAAANLVYATCKKFFSSETNDLSEIHTAHDQFLAAGSPAFLLASSTQTSDALAAVVRAVRDLVDFCDTHDHSCDGLSYLEQHRSAIKALERKIRLEMGIEACDLNERTA